jgi:hypothetical protein
LRASHRCAGYKLTVRIIDQTISLRNGEKTVKHSHANEPIRATRTNISHRPEGLCTSGSGCIIGFNSVSPIASETVSKTSDGPGELDSEAIRERPGHYLTLLTVFQRDHRRMIEGLGGKERLLRSLSDRSARFGVIVAPLFLNVIFQKIQGPLDTNSPAQPTIQYRIRRRQ